MSDKQYIIIFPDTEKNKHLNGATMTVILSKQIEDDGEAVICPIDAKLNFRVEMAPILTPIDEGVNKLKLEEIQKMAKEEMRKTMEEFNRNSPFNIS